MLKFPISLMAMTICAFAAHAAIFHDIDTTEVMRCTLSKEHQNRIIVENGSVKKILFPEGSIFVQMEEDSGQAFVYALENPKPLNTLSVITDGGFVQDIEVEFSDTRSEVIVLREPIQENHAKGSLESHYYDDVVFCLKELLSGKVPEGYKKRSLEGLEQRKYENKQIDSRLDKALEGPHEILCFIELKNKGQSPQLLEEVNIQKKGDLWVYFDKRELSPKEKTFVIISKEKS